MMAYGDHVPIARIFHRVEYGNHHVLLHRNMGVLYGEVQMVQDLHGRNGIQILLFQPFSGYHGVIHPSSVQNLASRVYNQHVAL